MTIVAYGSMVPLAEQAADDPGGRLGRGARPALAQAARRGGAADVGREDRAGRRRAGGSAVCGFAAEVAAVLAEKAILDLRGPVLRVTGYDVPYPYWQLEDVYMPSVACARRRPAPARFLTDPPYRIVRAARAALLGAGRRTGFEGCAGLEPRPSASLASVGAE